MTEKIKDEVKEEITSKPVVRKPVTKKTTKKVEPKEAEPKEVEPKEETKKTVKEERKKAVQIDHHELIAVRSVTRGGLTYKSQRDNLTVRWDDFGAEEYMEFGDLLTMKASKPKFLTEPYLVVDDEDAIERLNLKSVYENMIDLENLEDFYKQSPDEIEAQLDKMPKGIRKLIVDTARQMVQNGTLYDIRKIKLLENKLKVGLQVLMD